MISTAGARPAHRRPRRARARRAAGVLSLLAHPLLLLVAGAWLSGMIVPRVTQGWQDRAKALEIRTQLVSDMSESATRMMTSIQEVRRHPRATVDRDAFSRQFTDWTAASAVTAARVEAYFPGTTLPADWGNLAGAIGEFYAVQLGQLSGAPPSDRADRERKIAGRLEAVLRDGSTAEWRHSDPARWWDVRDSILVARAVMVRRVLDEGSIALR